MGIGKRTEQFGRLHGRTAEEAAACAAYCKKWWPEETAHRLRIADEVTEKTFLFDLPWDMERTTEPVRFSGDIDWLYQPGDDPEFIYQMNRHRYWVCLGQAYAMTGEERYAKCFAEQLEDWILKNPITEETRPKTWRTIEAGLRAESWIKAMGYMISSPAVTESVFERFEEALACHGAYLAACDVPFSIKSNWGVLENSGLYVIGKALESLGGHPEAKTYSELAKRRLIKQLEVQVMDDGVHWEQSPMYHNEVLKCYLEVLRVAARYEDTFLETAVQKIRSMAYADRIWQKPDGSQPSGGDSDVTDLRDILTVSACQFDDPVLKSGGYERLDFEGIWDYGTAAQKQYERLEARDPQETFSWLADSGNWYLRSSWKSDADYLHVRCGSLGGGHGHFDKLHLDLVLDGEDILIDPGRYTYVDGEERRRLKSARAHNSVTVDGNEYTTCLDSWEVRGLYPAGKGSCCRKGDYTLITCSHLGYIQNGVQVERRVLAIGTRIYLIMDTCYGAGVHTLEQHFHVAPELEFSGREDGFSLTGKRCKTELICPSEDAEVTEEAFGISRHYNQMELGKLVTVKREGENTVSILTAVVCRDKKMKEPVHVSLVPVVAPVSKRILDQSEAEAIEICCGKDRFLVVNAHVEAGADCEYIGACGSYGLGRVMVTREGENGPEMTVMAW